MLKIDARKILQYQTRDLFDKLKGNFVLVFDDGEIVTNSKETIYSSYVWDFHRKYPLTPLLIKHHIQFYSSSKRVGASTHLNVINAALWSTYDVYLPSVNDKTKLLDDLAQFAYEVSNNIYNDLTYSLEEYVTSLDITDFIAVTKDPQLVKAMDEMPETQKGIDDIYDLIKKMFKSKKFEHNPLVHAINSGIANMGQALQCVGPRGFLTDIDSNIFRHPIKRGFVHGIRDAHDMMIETRSAAKSLIFSTSPLQQAEYFSRRQQFICQNVKHLHHGDCGSTQYLDWQVRPARYSNDEESIDINERDEALVNRYQSDLDTICGKYYLDETTGKLNTVKGSGTHLIGKTIKLRSPIAGCNHPDPFGICETCYGETALAIPANSNLGHATCVSMTAVVGQSILSTKHFDGSSVVEGIVLKPHEKKYLSALTNSSTYNFAEGLKNKSNKLIIKSSDALGLTDVTLVDSVNKLSLARISEFEEISLAITGSKDTEIVTLNLSINDRCPSFTYEMLNYIKRKGWTITDDSNYVIDLDEWDYSKPFAVLPLRHYNMTSFQSEIATMLESTVEDMEKRSNVIDPRSMIVDFHDLVNKRLAINLATLEVILYSSMGVNPMQDNYSLPKVGTNSGIGVMRNLLTRRSLSATLGFQGHRELFTNPTSYTLKNRPDHVFDRVVQPSLLNN